MMLSQILISTEPPDYLKNSDVQFYLSVLLTRRRLCEDTTSVLFKIMSGAGVSSLFSVKCQFKVFITSHVPPYTAHIAVPMMFL